MSEGGHKTKTKDNKMYQAHGAMMSLAWALLVPFSISFADGGKVMAQIQEMQYEQQQQQQ